MSGEPHFTAIVLGSSTSRAIRSTGTSYFDPLYQWL